jgi:hypothetical protein
MFGGITNRAKARQAKEGYPWGELWEYSLADNRWVNHELPGAEDRRAGYWRRLFYDEAEGGRLLLLGPTRRGGAGGWALVPGGPRWERLSLSGPPPESWKGPGGSTPMAYDPRRRRFVMLDTWVAETAFARTLVFDPRTATFRRVEGPQPPPRRYHDLVHDTAADRVVLFGGMGVDGPRNDTWLFDPDREAWSPLDLPAAPPPRRQFAMAYDTRRHVTLVYGGYGGDVEPRPYRVWALRLSTETGARAR